MKNDYKIVGDTAIIYVNKRNGKVYEVLIDTEDLPFIKEKCYSVTVNDTDDRAYANGYLKPLKKNILIHRLIMCPPADMVVDHKFHNTLDNRKSQLRICTAADNSKNAKFQSGKNTRHGDSYRGVNWQFNTGKYQAKATIDGVIHRLGTYDTPKEANEVVVAFRRKHMPFSTI